MDDFDGYVMGYLADLCHLFPGVTPWNVYRLELRHLIVLTRAVDAERSSRKDA